MPKGDLPGLEDHPNHELLKLDGQPSAQVRGHAVRGHGHGGGGRPVDEPSAELHTVWAHGRVAGVPCDAHVCSGSSTGSEMCAQDKDLAGISQFASWSLVGLKSQLIYDKN